MTIKSIVEDLDNVVSIVNELKYSPEAFAQMDIFDIEYIDRKVKNALSIVDELYSYLTDEGEDNE